MKICHILSQLRPSGAEMMFKNASELWKFHGCKSQIISISDNLGPFAEELSNAGYEIHHLSIKGGILSRSVRYFRLVWRIRPDVVHVHPEGESLVYTILPRFLGIKTFSTKHSSFQFIGFLRLRKSFERMLSRVFGCTQISISQTVHDNELLRFGNPTTLCWNWFDENKFRPPTREERQTARRDLGITQDQIILLSVGNGSEIKNYESIISAVALSKDPSYNKTLDSRGKRLHYLMVGYEHPQGIERKTYQNHGLSDSVTFCGPQQDVRKYLWAADIFLMPSRYEGFGIAAAEALATGIPTILSDVPGLRDFKEFPIPIEWCMTDPTSIIAAISRIIDLNPEFQRDEKMADLMRKEFSCEKRAMVYFKLWEQCRNVRVKSNKGANP
jgi:glycosyltransferase involved in cell wall biosynthesis